MKTYNLKGAATCIYNERHVPYLLHVFLKRNLMELNVENYKDLRNVNIDCHLTYVH